MLNYGADPNAESLRRDTLLDVAKDQNIEELLIATGGEKVRAHLQVAASHKKKRRGFMKFLHNVEHVFHKTVDVSEKAVAPIARFTQKITAPVVTPVGKVLLPILKPFTPAIKIIARINKVLEPINSVLEPIAIMSG